MPFTMAAIMAAKNRLHSFISIPTLRFSDFVKCLPSMRYASKSLKKKPGFYYRRTSRRLCSSVFDLPLNEPSTPISPETEDFVIEESFNAFAEGFDSAIESPEFELDPGACRVHTSDSLHTVNEGTPVLRYRPGEVEPFPHIIETSPHTPPRNSPKVSNPTSVLSFTDDREHLRDLEKLHYLRSRAEPQRSNPIYTRWRDLSAELTDLAGRDPGHLLSQVEEVKANRVNLQWRDNSEDSINETMILPRIRPSKKANRDEFEEVGSIATYAEEVPEEAPIEIRLPNHMCKFIIPQTYLVPLRVFANPPGSQSSSLQLVKTKTKPPVRNHSTMGRFYDMALEEMYGQLIKGIIRTQNLNALCRAFFCNIAPYGSQCLKGFSQALSMGLKASEAVKESQKAFMNLEAAGVKCCVFARNLGESIPELQCYWDYQVENEALPNCKTQVHLNSQGYIRIQLDYVDYDLTEADEQRASNREKLDTASSVSSSTRTRFIHAENLCVAADNMLIVARDVLST